MITFGGYMANVCRFPNLFQTRPFFQNVSESTPRNHCHHLQFVLDYRAGNVSGLSYIQDIVKHACVPPWLQMEYIPGQQKVYTCSTANWSPLVSTAPWPKKKEICTIQMFGLIEANAVGITMVWLTIVVLLVECTYYKMLWIKPSAKC